MGFPRFLRMVNREVSRWEGRQVWRRIVQAIFTALTDPAGVTVQRIGALERAGFVLGAAAFEHAHSEYGQRSGMFRWPTAARLSTTSTSIVAPGGAAAIRAIAVGGEWDTVRLAARLAR
jgi:hypothetical protein